jgi:hypothetical protein
MKRFIVILAVLAVLFLAACGADYYDRVIRNDAVPDVTYTYDGKRETLSQGDSRVYSVTLAVHAPSPSSIDFTGHEKSVVMKPEGWDYIFVDVPAIPLVVYNTLTEEITISNEYIDKNDPDDANNDTSFNVDAAVSASTPADSSKESDTKAAVIYTSTPVFTVTSNALPSYDFEVETNIENNGRMGVTIR